MPYDFSKVISLTHQKTQHIIDRDGHAITGFVLTKSNGEKCIVDMSAVRWFVDGQEFFRMMHPDANQALEQRTCTYLKCNFPFDAPADPNWCARKLPRGGT